MPGLSLLADPIRAALFALSHLAGGSLGAAIVLLSLAVRLALLPLTVRLALEGYRTRERVRALEPELARLRRRFGHDRARLIEETGRLYRRHGIRFVPRGALLSLAVQAPVVPGLLAAIGDGIRGAGRFLWMADLARPDALLALLAAASAALAALLAPADPGAVTSARVTALVVGVVTLVVVWRVAAGVGLYWAASNAVGVLQSLVVRRAVARRRDAV